MTTVTRLIHNAGKYLLISIYPLPTHPTHNFTHKNGGNLDTLPGWPKKLDHNRPARCAGQRQGVAIYYGTEEWLSIMTPRSGYLLWRQGVAIHYGTKEWLSIMTPKSGYLLWHKGVTIYHDAKECLYLLWRQGVAIYYDANECMAIYYYAKEFNTGFR